MCCAIIRVRAQSFVALLLRSSVSLNWTAIWLVKSVFCTVLAGHPVNEQLLWFTVR